MISYNSLKLDPGSLRLEMEAVSRDLVARQVEEMTINKRRVEKISATISKISSTNHEISSTNLEISFTFSKISPGRAQTALTCVTASSSSITDAG